MDDNQTDQQQQTLFVDATGQTWQLPRLTYGLLLDLEQQCGARLYDGDIEAVLREASGDIAKLVTIVWHLLEPQLTARGIDQAAFWRSLDGAALNQMGHALWYAVAFFCPSQLVRRTLLAAIRKAEQIETQLATQAEQTIAAATIDDLTASGSSPSNSPADSASAVSASGHSGNSAGCGEPVIDLSGIGSSQDSTCSST